jgi:hypothetical protein
LNPSRTVVPVSVRTATRPPAPADNAAATRAAAAPTRVATRSICRLARRPVAHQVAKCSQLATTGE